MALFRDRRVFPRWAFIDSRTLPRPRYAKDGTSAESVPTPPEAPSELDSAPEVEVQREPQPVPAPSVRTGEVWVPEPQPQRAIHHAAPVSWIEERRNWFTEHDWPTQPSDEAVELASTHPDRPFVAPLHPGLPADSPAEVRARHGRGFSSQTRRRRRRRHQHEQPGRRADVDLVALEVALDAAAAAIGDGLLQVVVWHAATGLALASRGDPPPELAPMWHGATRDVRATLPHADLPAAGSYHLVGLEDRRLAVLLYANPDVGACLTVDLDVVAVDTLLATAIPQLRGALAATSREY